jgi:Heat induced stress protein YflT domain
MATNVDSIVIGVFTDHYEAQRGIDALQRAGFAGDQIHFVERGGTTTEGNIPADQPSQGVSKGSESAASGNAASRAAGSIGNVLSEVWAQLTGSVASSGNKLKDTLVKMGIAEPDADYYQNEFEIGRAIVLVRTTDRYEEAKGILRENGAYDVNTR